jgi:hypothetical protein
MKLEEIIDARLRTEGKCYGHCKSGTEMTLLKDGKNTFSFMSCPEGYVSRIVMYGRELDVPAFRHFLKSTAGVGEVSDADIRIATRHPWDLGIEDGGKETVLLKEAYWTQNYRRTKSDDPSREALFLCRECSGLYVAPLSGGSSHSHKTD